MGASTPTLSYNSPSMVAALKYLKINTYFCPRLSCVCLGKSLLHANVTCVPDIQLFVLRSAVRVELYTICRFDTYYAMDTLERNDRTWIEMCVKQIISTKSRSNILTFVNFLVNPGT